MSNLTITISQSEILKILKSKLIRPDIENIDEIANILYFSLAEPSSGKAKIPKLIFALLGHIPSTKYRIGDVVKVHKDQLYSWYKGDTDEAAGFIDDAGYYTCTISDTNVYLEDNIHVVFMTSKNDVTMERDQWIAESSIRDYVSLARPDLNEFF